MQETKDPFDIYEPAKRQLPRMMFDFIDGGTGVEIAQNNNIEALQSLKLQSRVLRNVEEIDLSTVFLGETNLCPFGFAPMGMCNLIAPNADRYMSGEAAARKIPHCVSTAASTAMETTIVQAEGNAWFQLYAGSNDDQTFEFVERARTAGYQHLIFTVDTPRHSRRVRDLHNGFSVPMCWGPMQLYDFASHPRWSMSMLFNGAPRPMNYVTSKVGEGFQRGDSRGKADFHFLARLRDAWPHKLIVKGVMSTDDALAIKEAGCDAIYVSNHGGRQLDSAEASIHALAKIREAVGPQLPLVFDSGIRLADDVIRALAAGADFVMIGRPLLYALGAGGKNGLNRFLNHFEEDLKSVMAQIGITKIAEIDHTMIASNVGTTK